MMPSWPGRLIIRARPISVLMMAPLVRRFRHIVRVCTVLFDLLDLYLLRLTVLGVGNVGESGTQCTHLVIPAVRADDPSPVLTDVGICRCKSRSPLSASSVPGGACHRLPSVLILPATAWCHSRFSVSGILPEDGALYIPFRIIYSTSLVFIENPGPVRAPRERGYARMVSRSAATPSPVLRLVLKDRHTGL